MGVVKNKKVSRRSNKDTVLGRKLFALRKKMPSIVIDKWYDWFAVQSPGMSKGTFNFITRGEYIAKKNEMLAARSLSAGAELLQEYRNQIRQVIGN